VRRASAVFFAALIAGGAGNPVSAQSTNEAVNRGLDLLKRLNQPATSPPVKAEPRPSEPSGQGGVGPAEREAKGQEVAASGKGSSLDLDGTTSPPAATARPAIDIDVVGLKVGMTKQQASDAMAKRYPSATRKMIPVRWTEPVAMQFHAGLVAVDAKVVQSDRLVGGESVEAFLAPPPSESVVVALKRSVYFPPGSEANKDEWAKSLVGKYGQPTVKFDVRAQATDSLADAMRLVWLFDKAKPGDPKASSGPMSVRCGGRTQTVFGSGSGFDFSRSVKVLQDSDRMGNAYTNWMQQAALYQSLQGFCGRGLEVVLEGSGSLAQGPLLKAVHFVFADNDLAAAAAEKTQAVQRGAREAQGKARIETSKQQKPVL
jgi:hypothetical protein